jgi:hypothetical protein
MANAPKYAEISLKLDIGSTLYNTYFVVSTEKGYVKFHLLTHGDAY